MFHDTAKMIVTTFLSCWAGQGFILFLNTNLLMLARSLQAYLGATFDATEYGGICGFFN
jgi:hypothetical protein